MNIMNLVQFCLKKIEIVKMLQNLCKIHTNYQFSELAIVSFSDNIYSKICIL